MQFDRHRFANFISWVISPVVVAPVALEYCDHVVRIPMAGCVESLNVSVTAGVLLYEAMRQRLA